MFRSAITLATVLIASEANAGATFDKEMITSLENQLDLVIDNYALDDNEDGLCLELLTYVDGFAQSFLQNSPLVYTMTSLNMANLYNERDCDKVLGFYQEDGDNK